MTQIAKLTRLVDAAVEPVSLTSVKTWLRVDNYAEDDLISDLITAARLECESRNNRSFIATTWEYTVNREAWQGNRPGDGCGWQGSGIFYPGAPFGSPRPVIRLPMPPLISVESMHSVAFDGVATLIDVDSFVAHPGTPGYVTLPYGWDWPSASAYSSVRIKYRAGYGELPADVPRNIVHAIRLLIAHYYEHRTTNAEVPDAVENLLSPTAWGAYV